MFISIILLDVCLTSFLHGFLVSSCGVVCRDKPKFTPSTLVVKYGDPAGLQCSVCEHCQPRKAGFEISVGRKTTNGTIISWEIDQMTEWDTTASCFYFVSGSSDQCCSTLPIHLYQPPNSVRISSMADSPQMSEGHEWTLQCFVDDVAPVEDLTVTFYRGHTQLGQMQSDREEKKPVSETFNLTITLSKEDDGGEFWCEAKLELGPGGPQPPPVVKSPKYTATVHYKPQLSVSSHPDPITVTEGDLLVLYCSAEANPAPSYNWTLPSYVPATFNGDIFTIEAVTSVNGGQYICSVSNSLGTASVTFDVTVRDEPQLRVLLHPDPITVTEGDTLVLNCSAEAIPAPSYTWTLPSNVPSTFKGDIFTIKAVTSVGGGQYICSVSNSVGTANVTFDVIVRDLVLSTTPEATAPRSRSTVSALIHRFMLCFMLLFSALF